MGWTVDPAFGRPIGEARKSRAKGKVPDLSYRRSRKISPSTMKMMRIVSIQGR